MAQQNDKKVNEFERTMHGCYGLPVPYSDLRLFLQDVFTSNRVAEVVGQERFAACIWGHAGIGKCVAGDTLIVSEKGIQRIDSLFDGPEPDSEYPSKGMKVHTPVFDKNPMKDVGFLYFAGAKPSIGIRTSYGRELV